MSLRRLVDLSDWDPSQDRNLIEHDNLLVPVLHQGEHLGTAVIHQGVDLKMQDQVILSELIRVMLTPALDDLRIPGPSPQASEFKFANSPDSAVFLLESVNPAFIRRVAVQIHEILGSWSFVKYEEIFQHIECVQDFQGLGPMTMLLPDLSILSQFEQALIFEHSQKAFRNQHPFLIIPSANNLHKIVRQKSLHQGLVEVLERHRLNLDAIPQQANLLKETLQLIFDSKAFLN